MEFDFEPRGPWKAFAIAGFVHGIVSLVFFFYPVLGIAIGIPGIVFSALGQKSVQKRTLAKVGLGLSIAGIVASVIWIIVLFTVLTALLASYYGI